MKGFRERWDLPHVIGPWMGSTSDQISEMRGIEHFNYKGFHSLVLLALVDTTHKFIWYDIAAVSNSDERIFLRSDFR